MLNWLTWTSLPFWSCFWEASHAWLTFMKCIARHFCVCPVYVLHHFTKFCVPLSTCCLYTDILMCHHPCSVAFSKFLTRLFGSAPEGGRSEHVLMRLCYRGQHISCLLFVTSLWGTCCAWGGKTSPKIFSETELQGFKGDMCNVIHVKITLIPV